MRFQSKNKIIAIAKSRNAVQIGNAPIQDDDDVNLVVETAVRGAAGGAAVGQGAAAVIYNDPRIFSTQTDLKNSIENLLVEDVNPLHIDDILTTAQPAQIDNQTLISHAADLAGKIGLSAIFPAVGAFVGPFVGALMGGVIGKVVKSISRLFRGKKPVDKELLLKNVPELKEKLGLFFKDIEKDKLMPKISIRNMLKLAPKEIKDKTQLDNFIFLLKQAQRPNPNIPKMKFRAPSPKITGFVGAFSGVISGGIQGAMYGNALGPWGIVAGIFIGAATFGLAGFIGGFLGGGLLKFITDLFQKKTLPKNAVLKYAPELRDKLDLFFKKTYKQNLELKGKLPDLIKLAEQEIKNPMQQKTFINMLKQVHGQKPPAAKPPVAKPNKANLLPNAVSDVVTTQLQTLAITQI
jgi:hypothetical protein